MATEVRHGPHPKFTAKLSRGRYRIVVEGRYTHTPGLTAAGIKAVRWNSDRPAKRQAELLGLRTAFLCWFMETWVALGGTWASGVRHVTGYPFARLQRQRRRALKPASPRANGRAVQYADRSAKYHSLSERRRLLDLANLAVRRARKRR